MAQGDPEPTPHRSSQASESANQAISDTFYGDLSSDLNDANNSNSPDAGPDEVLIPTGPEVDRATQRANEAYRAMFGDAANNRQSMMSAIEVLLPEESADSEN